MTGEHDRYVLDASAVLALLHSEPGAETVEGALERAAISTVNWSQVHQRRLARGVDVTDLRAGLEALGIEIVRFDADDAEQAAELWSYTREQGLSLGDRACLGLALRLGLPVLTADRVWLDLDVGVDIQAIR